MEHTLSYFRFFGYAPTLEQLHLFFPEKITNKDLSKVLHSKKEICINNNHISFEKDKLLIKESCEREEISRQKIQSMHRMLSLLGKLPGIQFIGMSGSVAAGNAKKEDDIDIFVITSPGYLWTARFFIIVISSLLGIRRYPFQEKVQDKLCFNLFFDKSDMHISKEKQTEYVAHEVLQVIPIVNKNNTYERFLWENSWVTSFFPNSASVIPARERGDQQKDLTFEKEKFNFVEYFLRAFQLFFMSGNRTTERITETQLWFFPDDFEKRMYNCAP